MLIAVLKNKFVLLIILFGALSFPMEWWGAGMVICLERGADLHIVQLMPLPLIVSCFSKIQIGFTFLVPAHPVVPDKGPLTQFYLNNEINLHNLTQRIIYRVIATKWRPCRDQTLVTSLHTMY